MDVPGIVRERLADERRMTSVNVGGDDRVYVTPPKTLIYHASGLFSSEEIEEYSHDARRFDVSADRREATFAFEYDDGVEAFSAPRERIDTVLPPVLAGVLQTTGLIDSEESIEESYRFDDRTLVVTDKRLLTSVGEAVWDREHESYAYESITDLRFENALVIEIDGRSRRIELGDDGREAYETVETALCSYHGVSSVEELPESQPEITTAERGSAANEQTAGSNDTERSVASSPPPDGEPAEPAIREAPESGEHETTAGTASESGNTTDITGELDALRESIERQTELLERQQETLERLAEELPERVNDDR